MDSNILISLSEKDLKAMIAKTLREKLIARTQERAEEIAQFIIDDLIGREFDQSNGYAVLDGTED